MVRMIYGEDLRDELIEVRKRIKKIPLGTLVERTAAYIRCRDTNECDGKDLENPNYQVVRNLLDETIHTLIDELNERERKYLKFGE